MTTPSQSAIMKGSLLSTTVTQQDSARPVCSDISESTPRVEISACLSVIRIYFPSSEKKSIDEFKGVKSRQDLLLLKPEQNKKLVEAIRREKQKLREERRKSTSSRFVRGCLNGVDTNFGKTISYIFNACTLRRTNTPNTIESAQGAQISFTRNLRNVEILNNVAQEVEQKNQIDVQAAFRGTHSLNGNTSASIATEFQRSNDDSAQQASLSISAGIIKDFVFGIDLSDQEIDQRLTQFRQDNNPRPLFNDFLSIRFSGDISYNRLGVFPNNESDACITDPAQPFCNRQNLETIRFSGTVSPYTPQLNGNFKLSKSQSRWQYAISPTIGIVHDRALNDNVVLATGEAISGGVTGLVAQMNASLSPDFMNNRWQLSTSAQIISAFDIAERRVSTFESTSREFTAQLNYALNDGGYIDQTTNNNIIPSISIQYTNGSDSLRQRAGREQLIIALTVLY